MSLVSLVSLVFPCFALFVRSSLCGHSVFRVKWLYEVDEVDGCLVKIDRMDTR